jgi:hypothetical protein
VSPSDPPNTGQPAVDSRAVSTDILLFRARVLAVCGRWCSWAASDPWIRFWPCARATAWSRSSGCGLQDARDRGRCGRKARSAVGGHAALSSDGHVLQAADRLASARARRAAAAPDDRCAGPHLPCRNTSRPSRRMTVVSICLWLSEILYARFLLRLAAELSSPTFCTLSRRLQDVRALRS